jgi:hypothetical protein
VVALSEGVYLELRQGRHKPGISVLCPGFVNTNILKSERNRPADLPDASPQPTGFASTSSASGSKSSCGAA